MYRKGMAFQVLLSFALVLIVCITVKGGVEPVNIKDTMIDGKIIRIERRLDGRVRCYLKAKNGEVYLYYSDSDGDIATGDSIVVRGDIYFPDPPGNPGQFDYSSYLRRKGISGIIKSDAAPVITGTVNPIYKWNDIVGRLMFGIKKYVVTQFTEEEGTAGALFFGDNSRLDRTVHRDFQFSDCSHLLAVSGTHFTGFLVALPSVTDRLGLKRKSSVIIYIISVVLTGLITGWSESVTRAAFMSIFSFVSGHFLSGMALSSIVIGIADPYSLISPGFMMSFMAALSIKLFAREIESRLKRINFPEKSAQIIAATLAAQIGMIPFWQQTGMHISLIHLPIQIVASMLAQAACMFLMPGVLLSLIIGDIAVIPSKAVIILLKFIMKKGAGSSYGSVSGHDLMLPWTLSLYFLIIILLFPRGLLRRLFLKPSVFVISVTTGLLVSGLISRPAAQVVFADVGQGDCCLIMTRKASVLVDAGTYDRGREAVESLLDYYGIEEPDITIMTHWDLDHGGGIAYLAENNRIGEIYSCTDMPDSCDPLLDILRDRARSISEGYVISIDDDSEIKCIWPDRPGAGDNENSVVLYFNCYDTIVLLTGDIGSDTEDMLDYYGRLYDTDILKTAHHGSRYSTSEEFLDAVAPEYAIISAGKDNPYGHPSSETLNRLEDAKAEVYCTKDTGAVIVSIYEDSYSIRCHRR